MIINSIDRLVIAAHHKHTTRCAFSFAFKIVQINDFVFRQTNLRLLTDEKAPAAGGR